jgi:hypothetical protein
MEKCGSAQCSDGQNVNPASCGCAFSYNGKMVFRAPFFVDLVSSTPFQLLESTMAAKLNLLPGSVALSDIHFNSDNYLQVQVKLFPTSGVTFNLSELTRIGSSLSNQIYKPPANFGPYFFIADPYAPLAGTWISLCRDSHFICTEVVLVFPLRMQRYQNYSLGNTTFRYLRVGILKVLIFYF